MSKTTVTIPTVARKLLSAVASIISTLGVNVGIPMTIIIGEGRDAECPKNEKPRKRCTFKMHLGNGERIKGTALVWESAYGTDLEVEACAFQVTSGGEYVDKVAVSKEMVDTIMSALGNRPQ